MKKMTRVISTFFAPHKNNFKILILITFLSLFSFLSLINSVNVQNSVITGDRSLKPVHSIRNIKESDRTDVYIEKDVHENIDNDNKDISIQKSFDEYKGIIY